MAHHSMTFHNAFKWHTSN